ncbi:MAG TPA: hypothetical protein VGD65_18355 [Chryseosolibacter sp.]
MKTKTIVLTFLSVVLAAGVSGQEQNKWSIGVYTDLVKSGNTGFLEHFQAATEVNYQAAKCISVSGGFEYWGPYTGLGMIAGLRYYPHKNIFFRARRIFFIDSEAIGGGWKNAIGKGWNVEAMADYYVQKTMGDYASKRTVAVRAGITRSF